MILGKKYVDIDTTFWSVTVIFEFQAVVMMMGIRLTRDGRVV